MKLRGCLSNTLYLGVLFLLFGISSYFWFTLFVRGRSIQTPNLVGKTLSQARAVCSDLGLVLVVDNTNDRNADKVAVGAVVWQNRSPGTLIKRRTRIHVGQSLGPLVLSVPDLMGQTARTALLRFSQRNLKLANISYVDAPGVNIIALDPPSGTVVQGQTGVSLLVAYPAAPPSFVMPDLIDRNVDEVRYALEHKGLTISNIKFETYPGIADGTVIRQFPLPGGPVSRDDSITLVVSKQEEAMAPATPGPMLQ